MSALTWSIVNQQPGGVSLNPDWPFVCIQFGRVGTMQWDDLTVLDGFLACVTDARDQLAARLAEFEAEGRLTTPQRVEQAEVGR